VNIVILGLSITSSWGNGHATTYRSLVRELARRGHNVLFLEREVPWYAANRDLPTLPFGSTELYSSLDDLKRRFTGAVREADLAIVGSYVPDGVAIGYWLTETARGVPAFYDIDTPVTLAKLERGDTEYLSAELIPRYRLYLSFTGGPTLDRIERQLGSPMARVLYCSVDPDVYYPQPSEIRWDLGYMGTYSDDRQPRLECLMLEPARRWASGTFAVAGPLYPETIAWPANLHRIEHLPPAGHRPFYSAQRFTLNITRLDMIRCGYSPSVRLFEAAACGTPIVSDHWEGLETILRPGREVLIAESAEQSLAYLRDIPESERGEIAGRARERILAEHTATRRAEQLEAYWRAAA
jgi:spore maturation protein CgeB